VWLEWFREELKDLIFETQMLFAVIFALLDFLDDGFVVVDIFQGFLDDSLLNE
jgi:hypothetical protein